jgi:hypothetical protein
LRRQSGTTGANAEGRRQNDETGTFSNFFVSFDYSSDALQEIESFFKRRHKVIVALTVQGILDEHIAKKLA